MAGCDRQSVFVDEANATVCLEETKSIENKQVEASVACWAQADLRKHLPISLTALA